MDLRKRNLAELTMAEELTKKVSEKINNGMTLLGTLVGGVNNWTQVSRDENDEMNYNVDFLILVEEQFDIRTESRGIIVPKVKKYSLFEGVLNNHNVTTGYPGELLRSDNVVKVKELYFSNDKIYLSVKELEKGA